MSTQTATIEAPVQATNGTVEFLESKHRITGLVLEIFIARGWLRRNRQNASSYQVTPKGERYLSAHPAVQVS